MTKHAGTGIADHPGPLTERELDVLAGMARVQGNLSVRNFGLLFREIERLRDQVITLKSEVAEQETLQTGLCGKALATGLEEGRRGEVRLSADAKYRVLKKMYDHGVITAN